jgi:hypothetical protein
VDNDELLRQHGLRLTARRLLVLRAVPDRATTDEIAEPQSSAGVDVPSASRWPPPRPRAESGHAACATSRAAQPWIHRDRGREQPAIE